MGLTMGGFLLPAKASSRISPETQKLIFIIFASPSQMLFKIRSYRLPSIFLAVMALGSGRAFTLCPELGTD
jgi:hypothetical protein